MRLGGFDYVWGREVTAFTVLPTTSRKSQGPPEISLATTSMIKVGPWKLHDNTVQPSKMI